MTPLTDKGGMDVTHFIRDIKTLETYAYGIRFNEAIPSSMRQDFGRQFSMAYQRSMPLLCERIAASPFAQSIPLRSPPARLFTQAYKFSSSGVTPRFIYNVQGNLLPGARSQIREVGRQMHTMVNMLRRAFPGHRRLDVQTASGAVIAYAAGVKAFVALHVAEAMALSAPTVGVTVSGAACAGILIGTSAYKLGRHLGDDEGLGEVLYNWTH